MIYYIVNPVTNRVYKEYDNLSLAFRYVLNMKKFCNKTYAIKSNLDKPPIFDMTNYKPVK